MLREARSTPARVSATPFRVRTEDGVSLTGVRVGKGPISLVFVHGFFGSTRKPRLAAFVRNVAPWFTVYAYDGRGHGESGGECTFGDREFLDVDAVCSLAREEGDDRVATLGISMGAIAVLRHAAFRDGVSCVVSISSPARWEGHRTPAVRRTKLVTATGAGRLVARALGVRISPTWNGPEDPIELVDRIAPTPLIVVHGRDDHFFDVEQAWELYRRAGEPKRLMLAGKFGHAEDGLTPEFSRRVSRRIYEAIGVPTVSLSNDRA